MTKDTVNCRIKNRDGYDALPCFLNRSVLSTHRGRQMPLPFPLTQRRGSDILFDATAARRRNCALVRRRLFYE